MEMQNRLGLRSQHQAHPEGGVDSGVECAGIVRLGLRPKTSPPSKQMKEDSETSKVKS